MEIKQLLLEALKREIKHQYKGTQEEEQAETFGVEISGTNYLSEEHHLEISVEITTQFKGGGWIDRNTPPDPTEPVSQSFKIVSVNSSVDFEEEEIYNEIENLILLV